MKKIKNNTKNIEITSKGYDQFNNMVSYQIKTDFVNLEDTITLFNKQLIYVDGIFMYNDFIHVANLPDIISSAKIETSDVGLNGYEIAENFGTTILYLTNILNLNMEDWSLIN